MRLNTKEKLSLYFSLIPICREAGFMRKAGYFTVSASILIWKKQDENPFAKKLFTTAAEQFYGLNF